MGEHYAQALVEAIKRGTNASTAVAHLYKTLEHTGRTKLLPRIAHALSHIQEKSARRAATLMIAKESERSHAIKSSGTDDSVMITVDDTLIGEWVHTASGVRTDGSFERRLLDLYYKTIR